MRVDLRCVAEWWKVMTRNINIPGLSVSYGRVVVTAYDFEPSLPNSSSEWGPIYYKAPITAHGLPEPSFFRG